MLLVLKKAVLEARVFCEAFETMRIKSKTRTSNFGQKLNSEEEQEAYNRWACDDGGPSLALHGGGAAQTSFQTFGLPNFSNCVSPSVPAVQSSSQNLSFLLEAFLLQLRL